MSATVLLLSLPKTPLIGIDLLTFTPSPRFHGIIGIPVGWHFIFTSPTTSLSIRHGTWFCIPLPKAAAQRALIRDDSSTGGSFTAGALYIFTWSTEREELVPVTDGAALSTWRDRLRRTDDVGKTARAMLLPYRQTVSAPIQKNPLSADTADARAENGDEDEDEQDDGTVEESTDWPLLTARLSPALLAHFAQSSPNPAPPVYTLSTTSCAAQDRDEIPGLSAEDMRDGKFGGEEKELGFLGIDLKRTWREGALGRERTEGARDRSWALGEVVARNSGGGEKGEEAEGERRMAGEEQGEERQWGSRILGEMEMSFLMVLTLSNYSCLEEWKRILALVLTSRVLVPSRPRFFISFLDLLLLQLRHCDDVEGGLFDVHSGGDGNFLLELLKGFKRGLEEVFPQEEGVEVKDAMEELEEWVKREWGWEIGDEWLRRGMVELEDGERVEVEVADMEGEDERGEYAPVVVEL